VEHSVNHVTTFRYAGLVCDSVNEVRLRPLSDDLQVCLDFQLLTDPPSDPRRYRDAFGNAVHTFDVIDPHTVLTVTARSRVTTYSSTLPDDLAALPDAYTPLALEEAGDLIDFLQPTSRADFHPTIADYSAAVRQAQPTAGLGPLVWGLAHGLHERLEYVPGATDVGTIASEALVACRGVCQDYTHVLLAALRMLGIPARYTSGYFHSRGMGEVGAQASHAWVEVWFPSRGFVGVDPTNDRLVDDRYIRVAYGRDYDDVAPIKGSYRGAEPSALEVHVFVSEAEQQQQ
jgi:transglutaminase-like putative cysteine protease